MRLALVVVLALSRIASAGELTKADVRAGMKQLVAKLHACYVAPGVFNLHLALTSTKDGVAVEVLDFDASGELASSTELRACATRILSGAMLPPVAATGRLELLYPMTFAASSPGHRDATHVATARRHLKAKRWKAALAAAEKGLTDTSIDGTLRRPLIEIAGISACQLALPAKARRYVLMASPDEEQRVREACKRARVSL